MSWLVKNTSPPTPRPAIVSLAAAALAAAVPATTTRSRLSDFICASAVRYRGFPSLNGPSLRVALRLDLGRRGRREPLPELARGADCPRSRNLLQVRPSKSNPAGPEAFTSKPTV